MTTDPTAMFNDLQAYAPYGSPPCHIPHWLFDEYEEWYAASLRFYDANVAYTALTFRGTRLHPLHPLLAVARGL